MKPHNCIGKLYRNMAEQIFNVTKESKGSKVGYPELINVYYTALMIFLVFTAANDLVKGLIGGFSIELLLYLLLWLSMVIQTTFAYKHIKEIPPKKYNKWAFASDSLDICIFIYVCALIGQTCTADKFIDLETYRHISIPFLILSVNQFCWYVLVREKEYAAAVCRLILLFIVMLTATILDRWFHGFCLLLIIVCGNFGIMVILRAINRVPDCIERMFRKWWGNVKKTKIVRKLLEKLSKKEKADQEEMIICVDAPIDHLDFK